MSDILILHTSTIPGYEGRIRLIEPSLVVHNEPNVEAAFNRLADRARDLGGNAVLGVGVYDIEAGNSNHTWRHVSAFGTVVLTEGTYEPWVR